MCFCHCQCSRIFYRLPFFLTQKSAILTTVGVLEQPLGNARLHVARLVAALLQTSDPSICQGLCNLSTMDVLLVGPWSNTIPDQETKDFDAEFVKTHFSSLIFFFLSCVYTRKVMRVGSTDCLITPPGQSASHCCIWSRFIEKKVHLHFLPLLLSINLIFFIFIYLK